MHPITKSLCNHMINIMQEFQFIGAIYHLFMVQSMGHTSLSQKQQEYLIKTTILYINSRSPSVCLCVTRQFRVLIRRQNRPGQSDSENGIRPGQSDFCTGNLRGRFCNPSLCPFVRPSVRPSVCLFVRPSIRPSVRPSV